MKQFAVATLAMTLAVFATSSVHGQGLIQPAGGGMHQSMGGTSSAYAFDAIGALYWNPAVISGLHQSEVSIGSSFILPHTGVTSTIPAGAFGPLGPTTTQSGRTNSDSGLIPSSALGLVYRAEGSKLTYGLGMNTAACGGVNFPGDAANPILAPTGPLNQFILGPQAGSLTVMTISPTVSYQVTDSLAVGMGPMVDFSVVSFDPAFFGPPSQANPLAPNQFPTGSHSRPFWGGGFRGGVTYRAAEHVMTGVSYTSPQWFETWEFNARDVNGNATQFSTQFSLPQIFSAGVAYDGIDCLVLASDLRYLDYSTTKLLGQPIREGGAGWSSVWAMSVGAKYQLNDRASVQAGYLYNENPIPSELTLFNTMLPAITQHTLSVGSYFQLNDSIGLSLAYAHGFENTVGGSVAPLVGTTTELDSKFDAIVMGIHIRFGAATCKESTCCDSSVSTTSTMQ